MNITEPKEKFISSTEDELKISIKALYHTFASYRLKPHMEACPCCVYDNDKKLVHSKSLTKLTIDDLEKYAFKALTTWGDEKDFKHFLPRLFELQAFHPIHLVEPEILFSKLEYANWRKWPDIEQKAIEDYFDTLWKFILIALEPNPYTYSDDYLCGIGQAVDDLNPFLSDWQATSSPGAVRNLIEFINQNADRLTKEHKLANTFWDKRETQMIQVRDWLLNPLTHEVLLKNEVIQADRLLADGLLKAIKQMPNP